MRPLACPGSAPETTSAPATPSRLAAHAAVGLLGIDQEHLLLVKHMARLQRQMTVLVNGYEAQLRHWQRQLMWQSVRLMLERTRADWGLVPPHARQLQAAGALTAVNDAAVAGHSAGGLGHTLASAQTEALICRTGCQMDSDHWRDGERCKRSGQACALGACAENEMKT